MPPVDEVAIERDRMRRARNCLLLVLLILGAVGGIENYFP